MYSTKAIAAIAAAGLFAQTTANIKSTGLWSNYTFYDTISKIGINNSGVPYSNDIDTKRRIASGTPLDGDVSNYSSKTNVKRVKRVMTKSDFETTLFPKRNSIYTHDGFL